ncbi:MAG: hypothetical protein A2096_16145 [Spirochaetes bacterium GWF1_41_5]|nr:MAG: hypothetical protein A2096_16145 [Spirochaetes bacterium GWF1_41_5]
MTACEPHILHALGIIFDIPPFYGASIIKTISKNKLRTAYRAKVKLYHPDLAAKNGVFVPEKIYEINNAYRILNFLVNRQNRIPAPPRPADGKKHLHPGEPENKKNNFIYRGSIPHRCLRLAQFLYYNKIISWHTLVDSMIWQYQRRPRLGELAAESSYLDRNSINKIIRNSRPGERFGETARRLGCLTAWQICGLLGKQKQYKCPIGRYFLQAGILSEQRLTEFLAELNRHNEQYKNNRYAI